MKYILPENIQNTGSNVYNLAKALANMEGSPKDHINDDVETVFFDFLGFFLISYSGDSITIIHISICCISVFLPLIFISIKKSAKRIGVIILKIIVSAITLVISLMLAMILCFVLALMLDKLDKTMFW